MGWQYIAGTSGSAAGSGTELSCADTLNIAAGDLLVVITKWDGASTTVGVADAGDSSNAFTMLSVTTATNISGAMGYKIGATLKNPSTLKMTLGDAREYRYVAVMQFRPDGGETVTLEDEGTANGAYTGGAHSVSSDQISPTGNDICVVGGVGNYAESLSNQSIADGAATGIIETDAGYGSIWYKFFTEAQTDIDADVSISNSDYSIINILAFKSAAAGGPAIEQTDFQFFDVGDELPNIDDPVPPVVEAGDITEDYNNTASGSWVIDRPAQATGDLIIMHLVSDANVTHGTLPGGPNGEAAVVLMQHVGDAATASTRSSIWYWIATGANAAGNVTVTPSASEQWRSAAIRVLAGEFDPSTPIEWGAQAVATTGAPNIPAFTPTWGYGRAIGYCGVDADPVTGAPAGWTLRTVTTDRGAMNLGICTCDTPSVASTEIDGGNFAGVNDGWVAAAYLINAPTHAPVADGRTPLDVAGTDPELEVDTEYGVSIRVENSGGATTEDTYKWQYKRNSGSWTDITDVSSVIRAVPTGDFVDGADVPEYIGGAGSYVTGNNAALDDDGILTLDAVFGGAAAFESHLNFQIMSGDVVDGDTIYLRIVEEDGTAFDSYGSGNTNLPSILVNKEAGSGSESASLRALFLDCDAATYSVTGTAASTEYDRLVGAAAGSYAVAGTAVDLLHDFVVVSEAGSYAVTGQDIATPRAYVIAAVGGTYAVTGTAMATLYDRILAAEAGAYVLTGEDAAFLKGLQINAEAGSYAITGTVAALLRASILSAEAGSYAVTGTAASLLLAHVLAAAAGTYALTGAGVTLLRDYGIEVEAGTYDITGQAAALLRAALIAAGAGSYVLAGLDVTLVYTPLGHYIIDCEGGVYALTGTAVTFDRDRILAAGGGAYAVTGSEATTLIGRALDAGAGVYAVTGAEAVLIRDMVVDAEGGEYDIEGQVAGLIRSGMHVSPVGVPCAEWASRMRCRELAGTKVRHLGEKRTLVGPKVRYLGNKCAPAGKKPKRCDD